MTVTMSPHATVHVWVLMVTHEHVQEHTNMDAWLSSCFLTLVLMFLQISDGILHVSSVRTSAGLIPGYKDFKRNNPYKNEKEYMNPKWFRDVL